MSYTLRNCDNCGKEYKADNRNLKRGWGLTCSKSCASSKREKSRPNYNPETVAKNNILRVIIQEEKYQKGADRFARKRGFPDYKSMEESQFEEDGSWDAGGNVQLDICNICELRADYCECGEGQY